MTPTADLSILYLITKATVVVQFVMLLLALLSIASWTAIFWSLSTPGSVSFS